ncbi:MAG: Thymidylate kinase [Chlamydiae bacterium]|nr:Thymidylate kinase [Chlamydiota bacterium]
MSKEYKGCFITIEGGDGSGKSTLTEKLAQEFTSRGYTIVKTREPGGTPLSEKIRHLVLNPNTDFTICDRSELLLYLASRLQHIEEIIVPALREGKVVICERFNDSTIVYQGCARHLGMSYVEELCALACNGLATPDRTLYLDLDPEIGLHRIKSQSDRELDRLELEKLQFHKQVRQGYLQLADKHPERITIIDAGQPQEDVYKAALQAVELFKLKNPS